MNTPSPPRVGFLVTCLADIFRPTVGFAAIRLLTDAGCRVDVPEGQTCCGQMAYNSGDDVSARALAQRVITRFSEYDYIVAPSGSCATMLGRHYPALFAGDRIWESRARDFSVRCFELTSFLVDVCGLGADTFPNRKNENSGEPEWGQGLPPSGLARSAGTFPNRKNENSGNPQRGQGLPPSGLARSAGISPDRSINRDSLSQRHITYHDSCVGLRELGIHDQPRALLRTMVGIEIREMERHNVCCGFGGSFCMKYPEISTRMVTNKVESIRKSGADIVLGGDLGCLMNIAGRLKRLKSPCRVYHVAEVLVLRTAGAATASTATASTATAGVRTAGAAHGGFSPGPKLRPGKA